MIDEWGVGNNRLNLFKINERWGIRRNSIDNTPSVIVHRCDGGGIGNVHDLEQGNYKCDHCFVVVPDDVQAVWLLRTCDEADQFWMLPRRTK